MRLVRWIGIFLPSRNNMARMQTCAVVHKTVTIPSKLLVIIVRIRLFIVYSIPLMPMSATRSVLNS